MRLIRLLLVTVAANLLLLIAACQAPGDLPARSRITLTEPRPTSSPSDQDANALSSSVDVANPPGSLDRDIGSLQMGIAYTSWWSGNYSHPDSELSLTNLASTGANWISLLVTHHQETIASTTILTTSATPTNADLTHAITEAHGLGLKVMLKPHVDLLNDPTHWRGQIGSAFTTEAEWDIWFAAYESLIFHYADLAETYGVDQFCVGTELIGTTHRAEDWRSVIYGVRTRYSGPITYASNHSGEEASITWWDAVDIIGVDAYYPLTYENNPTLDELRTAWTPYTETLANLASTWGKSIIFTEIGYRSLDGANRHPWDWEIEGAVDLQEQADAYRAAFDSVFAQSWFAGMYWWEWGTDPFAGGSCDDAFTPHDKPAEDILRVWYGAPPRPTVPRPAPNHNTTIVIFADELGAGWEDWSWGATRDLAATGQVYSGTKAIFATLDAWGALSLHVEPALEPGPTHWLEFAIRGSSPGAYHLWASFSGEDDAELRRRPVDHCRYVEGGTIEAGTWKQVLIPLSDLDADGKILSRLSIRDRSGQATTSIWIDEIRLIGSTWRAYLPAALRR